jgi:hypothetical protein
MTNKKYHTVGISHNSIELKIVETEAKYIPLIHICPYSLSSLGICTSVESGGAKLILCC